MRRMRRRRVSVLPAPANLRVRQNGWQPTTVAAQVCSFETRVLKERGRGNKSQTWERTSARVPAVPHPLCSILISGVEPLSFFLVRTHRPPRHPPPTSDPPPTIVVWPPTFPWNLLPPDWSVPLRHTGPSYKRRSSATLLMPFRFVASKRTHLSLSPLSIAQLFVVG